MTITAVGSSPKRPAPLPLPTPADVLALQAVQQYPAVSVLASTDVAAKMTPANRATLRELCNEAEQRLQDELGMAIAAAVRAELEDLYRDAINRPTRAAVALYVSDRHRSAWSLPLPVTDRCVIDPTFATRDLVRTVHRTPRHVVLVLTDREARLFDGLGQTLLPPFTGPFPLHAAGTPRHPRSAPTGRTGRATLDGPTGDAFYRAVDRALGTYLSVHPAPLVLVGAPRTLTAFTHLSRNLSRLAGTVKGSHARTPLPVLAALIRPVLDSYLLSRQAEALALLDQRTSARRVVTGIQGVWLAARAERPEMLAVEQGLFYPARVSSDGDYLQLATDIEHPEVLDDAVDEVIETVLQRGGWVALVGDGKLATYDRIALTLRPR